MGDGSILERRAAGVLLHLSSVAEGPFCGDLGDGAYQTLEFLANAGQRLWQMLPVNPVGDGDSPYSTISCRAGEPLFVDLKALMQAGWLRKNELAAPRSQAQSRVDYEAARAFRGARLRTAFSRAREDLKSNEDFHAFCKESRPWVDDYALFTVLATHFGARDWPSWPEGLRDRTAESLRAAAKAHADEIQYLKFVQWQFDAQWRRLRVAAHRHGVALIGDLPIFVAHHSADVWANAHLFLLDKTKRPKVVAGCPPDAFNEDGQLWGNALYDWDALKGSGYDWWLARFEHMLARFDAVRLDHFIGFHRYWAIPAQARNARVGSWQRARGDELFAAAAKRFGGPLPFIAEDLGAVVPEVLAMRDRYEFPGTKVLQFAFDGSPASQDHKPYAYSHRSAAYTGTHDNDTARGWYALVTKRGRRDHQARAELLRIRAYLNSDERTVHRSMLRAVYGSPAALAIIPAQDLLGLSTLARMNVPGTPTGNWRWRLTTRQLTPTLAQETRALAAAFDRI